MIDFIARLLPMRWLYAFADFVYFLAYYVVKHRLEADGYTVSLVRLASTALGGR